MLVGVLVNPDAGLGGRRGFKGSDGRAQEGIPKHPFFNMLFLFSPLLSFPSEIILRIGGATIDCFSNNTE